MTSIVSPGDRLGQFEVIEFLGVGSFGAVYLMRDPALDEVRAVKVVATGQGEFEEPRRQLLNELRLRRKVTSTAHLMVSEGVHIVPDHRGLSLLLLPMEHAAGGSLRKWLTANRSDVDKRRTEGVEFWRQACEGVAALHAAGIVHLDLKPENLLLVRDEDAELEARRKDRTDTRERWTVKVADFGTSRSLRDLALHKTLIVTSTGGTPLYESPEQIDAPRPEDVDYRSDIYSLGVILYEILDEYGKPPFGGTLATVREGHLRKEPGLKGIPDEIGEVARRALAKKPGDRFGSVGELRQATEADPAEEALWAEARKADAEAAYERYLKPYPKGRHAARARTRVEELVTERESRVKAERERQVSEARAGLTRSINAGNEADVKAAIGQLEPLAGSSDSDVKEARQWLEAQAKKREEEAKQRRREEERGLREALAAARRSGEEDQVRRKMRALEEYLGASADADVRGAKAWLAEKEEERRQAEQRREEERRKARRLAELEQNLALEIGQGVRMQFVWIRAGEFVMGHHSGRWSGCPDHKVRITSGFQMGVFPVRQCEWEAVVGSNPSRFKGPCRPVERVSWADAQQFLQRLNKRGDGYRYRLPTEAEWEYAARAGKGAREIIEFGIAEDSEDPDEVAWCWDNSRQVGPGCYLESSETHSVGLKAANAFGLYDMLGNVSEWCEDWFQEDYYKQLVARGNCLDLGLVAVDPTGPQIGRTRVVRGGSHLHPKFAVSWWSRDDMNPWRKEDFVGFRCLRQPEMSPAQ